MLLVYLFPMLMDAVVAAAVFVGTVRAAEAGWNASAVAGLCAVSALSYSLASAAIGRFLNPRNAPALLRFSCLLAATLCELLAMVETLFYLWLLLPLLTIAMAFFFAPFQVFMKEQDRSQRSLAASTGLYTFAWSTGYALGPFVAGWLWTWRGWQSTYLADVAACLITLALLTKNQRSAPEASAKIITESLPRLDTGIPDLVWLGWLCGGLGCLTIAVIRSVFPSTGVQANLSETQSGIVFALLSGLQAVAGLALGSWRKWMYHPGPVAVFGLCGMLGLMGFACGSTAAHFFWGAACYGIYSGSFFFYFVWQSLAHPAKSSRYIAINEAIVGFTGVIGPVLGGSLADATNMAWPYIAASLLVASAVVTQCLVVSRMANRKS